MFFSAIRNERLLQHLNRQIEVEGENMRFIENKQRDCRVY